MSGFPTPGELWTRYEVGMGFNLTDESAKPLVTPYAGSGENYRRYYQDACIRAVFEKVAKPDTVKRALISLATGGGKTTSASLMLRRFADAGLLRKQQDRLTAALDLRLADAATLLTAARAELAAIQALPAAKLRRVFGMGRSA